MASVIWARPFQSIGPTWARTFLRRSTVARLEFAEVTTWAMPILSDYDQTVALDWQSEYLRKLESLTRAALDACRGQFLVGYTDLHPGLDWLAALRGTEPLLLDMVDRPDRLQPLLQTCTPDFLAVYDRFDAC